MEFNSREVELLRTIVLESERVERAMFESESNRSVYQQELVNLLDRLVARE